MFRDIAQSKNIPFNIMSELKYLTDILKENELKYENYTLVQD